MPDAWATWAAYDLFKRFVEWPTLSQNVDPEIAVAKFYILQPEKLR